MSDYSTYSKVSDFDKEAIAQILLNETYPRTVKEIRGKLKHTGRSIPEYLITRALRELLSEGRLRYKAGRWMSNDLFDQRQEPKIGFSPRNIERPTLSNTSEALLSEIDFLGEENISTGTAPAVKKVKNLIGPWGTFRKLLSYYSEAIRNEEGAKASAFLENIGKSYIYANGIGNWYPKTGELWSYVIPLGPHLSEFVKALSKKDNLVVLGYPIQAVCIKRQGEPDARLIRPVFQYILNADFTKNSITLSTKEAQPEISLEWLKYGLKDYSEQNHFLSACGLINQQRPIDEPIGFTSDDIRPDLDYLTTTLSTFKAEAVREPLNCRSVPVTSVPSGFKTGIYNRAVIMIGNRTRYTQTLLKELDQIGSQPDDVLNSTALSYIFNADSVNDQQIDSVEKPHEEIVADVIDLNAEQRETTSSMLTKSITVVTGPPGTGKSQVVMGSVVNARFKDQTVLFASRNHKAIDAVVERLKDQEGNPLIIRTNSKEGNLRYTFKNAILDVLTSNGDVGAIKKYKQKQEQLGRLLKKRGKIASIINRTLQLRDDIGEIEEKISWLEEDLPKDIYDSLVRKHESIDPRKVEKSSEVLRSMVDNTDFKKGLIQFGRIFKWFLNIKSWRSTRSIINSFIYDLSLPALPPFRKEKIESLDSVLFLKISDCLKAMYDLKPLEKDLKEMPDYESKIHVFNELNNKIQKISSELLELDVRSRIGIDPDSNDREILGRLEAAAGNLNKSFADKHLRKKSDDELAKHALTLLKYFPSWAVTNLSAGSRLPLVAGMFDLSIIDEASQCDIASAIPILYRSQRAAVVGDPHQLKHVSNLTEGKDALLRKRTGLTEFEDIRFSYREKSLYDLFAQTKSVSPHLLRETYRSSEEIADYSNQVFYKGMLRVATDINNLKKPIGMRVGINWTEIEGNVVSAGKSGCVCEEEVNEIYKIVRKILIDCKFRGTLGIVTPFRQQQKRINDKVFDSDIPYELLTKSVLIVDTAHGFQGDEKDVMLFSLCSGPDMPRGSQYFIREKDNLFNVAVSRARAVLHVVGNREWASKCGIDHIVQLAKDREKKNTEVSIGPWHPHESPWEKRLYEALLRKGIKSVPQYPVAGRRLDLALVDKEKNLKIDIEVDSDTYHRNPDGSRKKDDTWRDIFLIDHGWKIMRFWVYNLKEDMNKCVSKIEEAWSQHE